MAPDLRQLVPLYAAHRFTCHPDTVQTYSCEGKLLWSCKDEHGHFVQVESWNVHKLVWLYSKITM